jgi:ribonucleotide reductase beta subunit family protein with ferritin-like domain
MATSSILQCDDARLLLIPVRDEAAWRFYKEAVANFWTAEEIDLAHDDLETISPKERQALKQVLAFFAVADGIVGENLVTNFVPLVQVAEMRAFYTFQMAIETVHAEVYGRLIEALIKDPKERAEIFGALRGESAAGLLASWALRWTHAEKATFAERLVAFACVEGILFSGPFAVIFYFKTRGKLPGLCKSNEFIARDEAQHMRFACFLYRDRLLEAERLAEDRVHTIVRQCVDVAGAFVCEAIQDMAGLNSRSMTQYIEFVADVLLAHMGIAALYGATNPFSWMTMIGMPARTNFFEGRVSEYKRASGAAAVLQASGALDDIDDTDF